MSEIESVKAVADNGHKNRWGLKRFLYRQDGNKVTLNRKVILPLVAGTFIVSSFIAIARGPTETEEKSPIEFSGVAGHVQVLDIPAASPATGEKKERRGNLFRTGGLQVSRRPGFGKIPPGTMGRARLIGGASNGPVSAVLLDPVIVNGESLVAAGTRLFGVGTSGVDRLDISFNKFIYQDGAVQDVRAQACDGEDQTVGIRGSRAGKYATGFAAGAGLNFVAGMAEGLQETEVNGGVAYKTTSMKNALLNGTAAASLEQSKAIIEDWKEKKKIIEVKSGTEICLIFVGEL
ncbi:MAG: TrbI/VirB10 family protein [Bdellovibrionales bacterium]